MLNKYIVNFENSDFILQSTPAIEIMESHRQVQIPTPLISCATLNKLFIWASVFLICKIKIIIVLK